MTSYLLNPSVFQYIQNVILNLQRAVPSRNTLSVYTAEHKRRIRVSLQNNGGGLYEGKDLHAMRQRKASVGDESSIGTELRLK